jgi:hypothetical protein
MTMRLSPYGMSTCATCDSPDVTHAYDGNDDPRHREFIPQCAPCAARLQAEFPQTFVVLYQPR